MDQTTILVRGRRDDQPDPGPIGRALGIASLGIGLVGLVAPARMGRIMRIEPSTVWAIAIRDLVSGGLILGRGGPAALFSRAVFDLGDAVMMARRRPFLAALAAGTSLVGLAGGLALRE